MLGFSSFVHCFYMCFSCIPAFCVYRNFRGRHSNIMSVFIYFIFMVAPCININKILYYPTNALNIINYGIVKNTSEQIL